ncbi:L,D-transpeptidase [Methylobacterium sp. C25]|uniref:L,D-transpeptidase n=1 Tax=Methylobacterium sp. C25 TaxID=2721622 RepID=UPI001F245226|nr:L,D-transpeptidase [Methylobacterium sp. C25]MCE4222612.1 L,D-transpeptidase [Methylobacterium sp. C25]
MRLTVTLCAAGIAAILSATAAQAQSRSGQYGGGFIEYLVTGGETMRAPAGGRALRDDGVLPRHPAAYGYGGPDAMRYPDGDPYSGNSPEASAPRTRLAALPPQAAPQEATIGRAMDPRYERQVVEFSGSQRPGSIVIDTNAKYLYLVQGGGRAVRYGIGVGRPGFLWHGTKTISAKREWPDWTPPAEMLLRRPDLPRHMAGGPANPLGARAMYLGSSLYRIHGTNEPHTIGQAVSSGCIRMMNEDVIDLYERTPVGTRVEVI